MNDPRPKSRDATPGETILGGKYRIVGKLGSGGMGDVFEAWQSDLSRPVAIKLLNPKIADDPVIFQRFRREAAALASIGHPNIVHVIEFTAAPGAAPMLVMEKLEGKSLREVLREGGPMAPARAVSIALQLLSALAATHHAGVVHRDLKPANVIVLTTLAVPDFVKLIDFGIAKVDVEQLSRAARAPLTELGQVVGTLSYMAPEQAAGADVDGRADLFSLGCILFETISGQRARRFDSDGGYQALFDPCRELLEAAPTVDPRLAAIVDRSLALDPAKRFASAEAMAAALLAFAPSEAVRSVRDAPSGLREAPTRDLAAAAARPSDRMASSSTQVSAPVAAGVTARPQPRVEAPAAPVVVRGFGTQVSQPRVAQSPTVGWTPGAPPPQIPWAPAWSPPPAPAAEGSSRFVWVGGAFALLALAVGGVVLFATSAPASSNGADPAPSGAASGGPPSPRSTHSPAPPGSPSPALARDGAPLPIGLPACDSYFDFAFHRCDDGTAQAQKMWHGIARDARDRFVRVPRVAWPEIAKSCKAMEDKFRDPASVTCR